jgi:release factor glutamine methyltransferase
MPHAGHEGRQLTIQERIGEAREALVAAGLPARDARFDAEVLARHALGWDRAMLITRGREALPAGFEARFADLVGRRLVREPVALIIGGREFWGLEFEVSSDVLVPRPETEFLVEEALEVARTRQIDSIVDVGTGSGCVAIALATELPAVTLTATDVSAHALTVARRNAGRHGVGSRVRFVRANLLAGLALQAPLIVSNPPYVPQAAAAVLQPEVARYEPATALYGGDDGLTLIRRLLAEAPARLAPEGRLVFEFGDGQEEAVRAAAHAAGWDVLNIRLDLQGIARVATLGRDR